MRGDGITKNPQREIKEKERNQREKEQRTNGTNRKQL